MARSHEPPPSFVVDLCFRVAHATLVVGACDPIDEGAAAGGAPDNQLGPPRAPPPPPPAGARAGAADPNVTNDSSGTYASGEYTLGEDSDAYDDNDPTAPTDFRPTLDSHGAWSDDPTYGTVWTPAASEVGPDFTPYASAGHWVYDTDYVWVSDFVWGWALFHYGRWVFIEGRGWVWIPGREYRGAWVGWGVDDGYGYVGWYPLAPAYLWFGGVGVAPRFPIGPRWSYCGRGQIFCAERGRAPRVRGGAAAASVAGRVRAVPAVAEKRGPRARPGAWLGFSAAQNPSAATGTAAAGLAKAQQFSRPSTAVALGARPVTRASTAIPLGGGSRAAPNGGGASTMTPGTHAMNPRMAPQSQPHTGRPATQSAPDAARRALGRRGHHR